MCIRDRSDFLIKARNGYLKQAEQFPNKFEIIDAAQSKEDVLSDVINIIDALLAKQLHS